MLKKKTKTKDKVNAIREEKSQEESINREGERWGGRKKRRKEGCRFRRRKRRREEKRKKREEDKDISKKKTKNGS